ncbi:MAG TPA: NAD(P)-dependent oxidoreductase [Acidimicrobiales bacterium]|nr:NAD(P)-dependent oxidoreductase [Acidimicrobiales bacterium]
MSAPDLAPPPGVREVHPPSALHEMLGQADLVSLHLPLTAQTGQILDRQAFGRMRPGATVVNVGRGALIDETALVEALDSGRLGGAGLDVFEEEHPRTCPEIARHRLVVATPPTAGVRTRPTAGGRSSSPPTLPGSGPASRSSTRCAATTASSLPSRRRNDTMASGPLTAPARMPPAEESA